MANCNVKLYRKRQVLAQLEDNCAEPAILTALSGGLEVNVSPSVEAEVAMVERDVARATLTPLLSIAGELKGSAKFTTDFKGVGGNVANVAAVKPPVGKYLEGCGLGAYALKRMKVTGIGVNTVRPGAIITVTASPTVKLQAEVTYDATQVWLHYSIVPTFVGPAASDALVCTNPDGTVVNLTATATAGDVDVACGWVYRPVSSGHKNMTIRSEEDGFKKEIYAASGNFKFSADANGLGKFDFEFQGVVSKGFISTLTQASPVALDAGTIIKNAAGDKIAKLVRGTQAVTTPQEIHYVYTTALGNQLPNDVANGHFTTTEAVKDVSGSAIGTLSGGEVNGGFGDYPMTSGVVYQTTTPPILQDARLKLLNGQSYSPVFSSVSLDAGNEIVVRKDGNSFNGLQTARITARKPAGSADPEMMSQSSFDIFNDWFNGVPAQMSFQLGKGSDGNSMFVWGKKAQFTGNADGERDGISVVSSEFMLAGDYTSADDEYSLVFF